MHGHVRCFGLQYKMRCGVSALWGMFMCIQNRFNTPCMFDVGCIVGMGVAINNPSDCGISTHPFICMCVSSES